MSDDENVSRLANPNQLQHQRSKPHDNGAMKQLAGHLRRKKKRGRPKGPKGPEGRKPVNEDTKEERPAPPGAVCSPVRPREFPAGENREVYGQSDRWSDLIASRSERQSVGDAI